MSNITFQCSFPRIPEIFLSNIDAFTSEEILEINFCVEFLGNELLIPKEYWDRAMDFVIGDSDEQDI